MRRWLAALALLALTLLPGAARAIERELEVTATAYNSVASQTSAQPWVAAWGDTLAPGMKVIAVSRDLLAMGLRRGTVVRIEGLEGKYVVLDKMNKRWRRKIDVYMGTNVRAARRFGRRKLTIQWDDRRFESLAANDERAAPSVRSPDTADGVEPETP